MPRLVIVGMNNPVSSAPEHALYPLPRHHAGGRLWQMLCDECGATMRQYVDAFERLNLVTGPAFASMIAVARAGELRPTLAGRSVVLLGQEVRKSFGHLRRELVGDAYFEDCPDGQVITFYQVPHPSGRNLWYNDESNRRAVGRLLSELYRSAVKGEHP